MSETYLDPLIPEVWPELFAGDTLHQKTQCMFDFCEANPMRGRHVKWPKVLVLDDDTPLHVKGDDNTHFPGIVIASMDMDVVMIMDSNNSSFLGFVRVKGNLRGNTTNHQPYLGRGCRELIWLGAVENSSFDGFKLDGCYRNAIRNAQRPTTHEKPDNLIGLDLGVVVVNDAGSNGNSPGSVSSLVFGAISRVDTGGSGNTQLSTVGLPNLGDFLGHLETGDFIFVPGSDRPHMIRAISYTNKTVGLFPILDPELDPSEETPLDIQCSHGAAVRIDTGNSTGAGFSRLRCTRVGVGYDMAALYGGPALWVTGQAWGIAVVYGGDTGGKTQGGYFAGHYEAARAHIAYRTRLPVTVVSISDVVLDRRKIHNMGRSKTAAGKLIKPKWSGSAGSVMISNGVIRDNNRAQEPGNFFPGLVSNRIIGNNPDVAEGDLSLSADPTLTLHWDQEDCDQHGYISASIIVRTAGVITLVTDDEAKVMGQASYPVSVRGPVRLSLRGDGSDWSVVAEHL